MITEMSIARVGEGLEGTGVQWRQQARGWGRGGMGIFVLEEVTGKREEATGIEPETGIQKSDRSAPTPPADKEAFRDRGRKTDSS